MTRREFDRATKETWGRHAMASDERAAYRARRCLPVRGEQPDYLARRAAHIAARRADRGDQVAVLDRSQKARNVAEYRRANGLPLLGGAR